MEGVWRPAAVMLFVNARGEVLLQLRNNIPTIRFANYWSCIGGGLEPGETPEQAMLREVDEELGIAPGSHEYIGSWRRMSGDIHIYASRLDATAESLMPGLTEGQRVAWHTPQAAMMLSLVPWLEDVLPSFVRSDVYRRLTLGAYAPVNEEAASVIFVNRAGELLIRLRDARPGLPFPSCWDLIGGALEAGETVAEAAARETVEELCIPLSGQVYWGAIQGIVRIHVFGAPLDLPAESLTLTEGQRVAWFAPALIEKLPLVPYMERLIPEFAASNVYRRIRDGLNA
jgi:8-oxo-dGTP diphosphatase